MNRPDRHERPGDETGATRADGPSDRVPRGGTWEQQHVDLVREMVRTAGWPRCIWCDQPVRRAGRLTCEGCEADIIDQLRRRRAAELRLPPLELVA